MPKERCNFYIDSDLIREIRVYCAQERMKQVDFVRAALREHLKRVLSETPVNKMLDHQLDQEARELAPLLDDPRARKRFEDVTGEIARRELAERYEREVARK